MPQTRIEPELQEPFEAWQAAPSKQTMGPLLKAVDPIINTAVRSFGGSTSRSGTLRSQAKRLAAESFSSYDPYLGRMKTHLMSRLQRLRRIAAQQRQIIKVPEQVALDQMQTDTASGELEERLSRAPTDTELADYTGLSMKRLAYIRGSQRPLAQSTITRAGDEGTGNYDPQVTQINDDSSQWTELVYDDLDTTDQLIMERILGLHGRRPKKPNEVAKLLRVSPAAVSHRMAKIQSKLDKREELGML